MSKYFRLKQKYLVIRLEMNPKGDYFFCAAIHSIIVTGLSLILTG